MALVGLMSRAIGHLAALAAESSGVGSSVLPRDGASIAVVADEPPYRFVCSAGPCVAPTRVLRGADSGLLQGGLPRPASHVHPRQALHHGRSAAGCGWPEVAGDDPIPDQWGIRFGRERRCLSRIIRGSGRRSIRAHGRASIFVAIRAGTLGLWQE
jgi:hypothetical protein